MKPVGSFEQFTALGCTEVWKGNSKRVADMCSLCNMPDVPSLVQFCSNLLKHAVAHLLHLVTHQTSQVLSNSVQICSSMPWLTYCNHSRSLATQSLKNLLRNGKSKAARSVTELLTASLNKPNKHTNLNTGLHFLATNAH